jgi:uncharacterized protein YycO
MASEFNFEIIRYGPGSSVPTGGMSTTAKSVGQRIARPGDFILTHSTGVFGKLIRIGETLRYSGKEKAFAHWSHAAIFIDENGDIIEALGGGVQERNIAVYTDSEYVVVHLPSNTTDLDREEAVAFAKFCLDDGYGWLTIVAISICLLTGAKLTIGIDGQQICSALVARCIERIGMIFGLVPIFETNS